jgi:hypothetical protein
LPDRDAPIAPEITSNPKFSSFFDNAIGAIDGTQVNCVPSSTEWQNARNRKGGITHNVLACCSFDLQFQYFLSGSDGTAADSGMFNRAQASDLAISPGKYYLADAGFAACSALIIPYRRVQYHLAEWSQANIRYALLCYC